VDEFDESTPSDDDAVTGSAPGDTTVGGTAAADAEFEGRPLDEVDEGALASEARFDDEDLTLPPSDLQPDTQGEDPLIAELGEEGDGDLAPEDL